MEALQSDGRATFHLIILVIFLLAGIVRLLINIFSKVKESSAILTAFDEIEKESGWSSYYAYFLLPESGETLRLKIRKNMYVMTPKGSQGILTWKGSWFRSFKVTGMVEDSVVDNESDVPTIFSDSDIDREDVEVLKRLEEARRDR